MASLLDSKLGFGLACVACAAAGAIGVVSLRGSAPPPSAEPARAASWDGPLGPGALPASALASSLGSTAAGGGDAAAAVSGEPPLVDAAGRLAIDPALHRLFDAYLKNSAPREQELRAYLRRRLPQPALAQAGQLAGDYLRYLQAEAALRANTRVAPPGPSGLSVAQVEQMQDWQLQRSRMRERMLGAAVAQAWFGTEDADCSTALSDWRLAQMPAESEEVGSNELRARRLHGAVLEQRRDERARSCAAQLMDRLAAGGPAA